MFITTGPNEIVGTLGGVAERRATTVIIGTRGTRTSLLSSA